MFLFLLLHKGRLVPLIVHTGFKHIYECYGKVMSFKSNLVTGSSDAVKYPRMGMEVYIRAIIIQDDQGEIQGLYEESQARNGDAIAYELRREADMSSKFATRGLEMSYNGKFSSNGGIIDVDYHWAKSVRQARFEKRLPKFMDPGQTVSMLMSRILLIEWTQ